MKKTILIPFLMLAGIVASAQTFQVGPKAGVNISNFTDYDNSSTLVGFHLGGFVSFALGKSFALQPEVLFSTQGAKVEDISSEKHNLKANYLNIPVLAQIRMPGGLYLETGPQVGILLSAKLEDESIKDTYQSLDWSWAFGLGFRSKMGLGIGARYNLGLNKIGDDVSPNSFESNAKNSVIQVGLFFAIPPQE